jgi:hypothetical protein
MNYLNPATMMPMMSPAPSTLPIQQGPVAPTTTHYADYRTIVPPMAPLKIQPQVGINPGFMTPNKVTTTTPPATFTWGTPVPNIYNWGSGAPIQLFMPQLKNPTVAAPVAPVKPTTTIVAKTK